MTQLFGGRKRASVQPVNVQIIPVFPLTSNRSSGSFSTGRDGGGPPDADDLAGSEGGWGVPVQPVRQTGELG